MRKKLTLIMQIILLLIFGGLSIFFGILSMNKDNVILPLLTLIMYGLYAYILCIIYK